MIVRVLLTLGMLVAVGGCELGNVAGKAGIAAVQGLGSTVGAGVGGAIYLKYLASLLP